LALGEPDMVRVFGRQANPQPTALLDEGFGDFIDAEFTEELALPWEPVPRALPAPGQRPQPQFQRKHKGKPVRTVQ